jgi:ribosomal-protein-serine acetyltransferase
LVSILIDDDLLLRSWTAEDAPALFHAVEENRAHLSPWLPWVDLTTKQEHSATYIQQTLAMAVRDEAVHLGIFHQQCVIGSAGIHDRDMRVGSATIGYWIAKDFEGHGVMRRTLSRVIDFAFDTWALQRLELRCAASNVRSAALAQRLGFVQEGVLRRAHSREGGLEDLLVMGLLREEWNQNRLR